MGRPPAVVFEVLKKVFDIVWNENFSPPSAVTVKNISIFSFTAQAQLFGLHLSVQLLLLLITNCV
jgi:hypothetical protein